MNLLKEYLEKKRYKVCDVDESANTISVRYQMAFIYITIDNEGEFVNMALPLHETIDDSNCSEVIYKCLQLSANHKVVKAYTPNSDTVIISYEFYYKDMNDCIFQIEKGFKSLITAKVEYRKIIKPNDEE